MKIEIKFILNNLLDRTMQRIKTLLNNRTDKSKKIS